MAELLETTGGPVNETERAVTAALVEKLPGDVVVIPNIVIEDERRGQPLELDAIVVTGHAVFAVEIKGWHGRISTVNSSEWQLDGRKVVPNPMRSIEHKGRVLAGMLRGMRTLGRRRTPWVESLVILGATDVDFDLTADQRRRSLTVAEAVRVMRDARELPRGAAAGTYSDVTLEIARYIHGDLSTGKKREVVFASYRALDEVERTADGVIYTAEHTELGDGRVYRLRTWHVSPYLLTEQQQERRAEVLKRSSEALGRIGAHPNIAAQHAFGRQESTFYEVTAWSERGSLATAISRGLATRLGADAKLRLLIDVARGLEAAHASGVHHRNVHAGCVLLAPDGRGQLTGFDRAFVADAQATVFADVAGVTNDLYQPPELRGRDIEVFDSTDLYGLGVLAYDLFSGELPRREAKGDGYGWAPLSSMTNVEVEQADALDQLLLQMLEEDPDDRPASATEVIQRLEAILAPGSRRSDGGDDLSTPSEASTAIDAVESEVVAPPPPAPPLNANEPLPPGSVIDGQNVVEAVIGQSAGSYVYRVRNDVLMDVFALKLARPGAEASDGPLREFKLLRTFHHPGVVTARWAGRVADVSYVLLDLVNGPTLRDALSAGPMPTDQALSIVEAIADALDAVHAVNDPTRTPLVHRDLKPENIVLAPTGPVLIDFGSASEVAQAGHAPTGTLRYTAPDLADAGWSAAADQFALAVIAYECLTGTHPWGDGMPGAGRGAAPADHHGVSPEMSVVLERGLEARASDRFDSASEFASALRDAQRAVRESEPTANQTLRTDGGAAASTTTETPVPVQTDQSSAPRRGDRAAESSLSEPRSRTVLGHVPDAGAFVPWTRAFVEAVVGSENPCPVLAQQVFLATDDLADTAMAHVAPTALPEVAPAKAEALLDAEARLLRLESPLPSLAPRVYLRLAASWGSVKLHDSDGDLPTDYASLPALYFDSLHPWERRWVLAAIAARGRAAVVRAGAADQLTDVPVEGVVQLPQGRREDGLEAALKERGRVITAATETFLDEHPMPVWISARQGAIYSGNGLSTDVAAGASRANADRIRSAWTSHFGGARRRSGERVLPGHPDAALSLDGLTVAVGRFGWPQPPDSPCFQSGGLSLPERVVPRILVSA